jgi:hypothetical protein
LRNASTPQSLPQQAPCGTEVFAHANPVEIIITRIYSSVTVTQSHGSEMPLMGKSQVASIAVYRSEVCRSRAITLPEGAVIPFYGKSDIASYPPPNIVSISEHGSGTAIAIFRCVLK